MTPLRSWARTHALDILIVAGAVEAVVEVAVEGEGRLADGTPVWLAAVAAGLVVLTLLGRRWSPFAAPVALWLLACAISFADGSLVTSTGAVFAAGMAASFLLGSLRDDFRGRMGLAIVVGGAAIVTYNDPGHAAGDLVAIPALFAIAWLAGFALRKRAAEAEAAEERATHAEREREAAARVAVAEERARIARELHDIVAHSMSVMVLQVGAVRHRLPDALAEDAEALEGVERTGRSALGEMRRLLGAMRREGDAAELAPQPGLDRLELLLQEVRSAGLPVRLRVDGDPFPLPDAVDLSAYRIVQEGLTNALKHAHASEAQVVIRYGDEDLGIEVRDDGAGGGSAAAGVPGHGLVGIRERVKIYGGDMTAATENGGGFVLRTRLPLSGSRA
jgi:signal transduction histidine kinase